MKMDANESGYVDVLLAARQERHFIRPEKSFRHVDFHIKVGEVPERLGVQRTPLNLALVLDRSGSMQGWKLETAKRATEAVVNHLSARDRIAVVVFDDRIDVIQQPAAATAATKARVRSALAEVEARSMTALHEGWLTGCRAIAGDAAPSNEAGLARCFLLTDGMANVGLTDPEQIASEAAGIRDNAGIGTSTFGIGVDYDESLLGPMAVAGGGQFHHLRSTDEIANTFIGELGELLSVAVSQVRLELEVDPAVSVEVVSEYRPSQITVRPSRWSVLVGELLGDEERHIVVRFGFPQNDGTRGSYGVRSRLLWVLEGRELSTDWQEVMFSYADNQACSAETKNPDVMHWVGLHQAEWAKREAVKRSRDGDIHEAPVFLRKTLDHISAYAGSDPDLLIAMEELADLEKKVAEKPLSSSDSKEAYYHMQRRSRGQKDLRDK